LTVPTTIDGSSLVTSPEGGIWVESKRTVLWCVSEIGSGEKFHLQAQFKSDTSLNFEASKKEGKLVFPVEVRCQCSYAQISNVQLDIEENDPSAMTTKIAKRFRLSHKET